MPPRTQRLCKRKPSSKSNPSHTCIFLTLPEEIQMSILKELGGYFDLKRVGRTCKTIQRLLSSPSFDKELFRGSPSSEPLKEGIQITLHPLIENIFDIAFPRSNKALIESLDESKSFSIIELKASNENATSPPLSKIIITRKVFDQYFEIGGDEDKVITVKDFVEQVAKVWSMGIPSWYMDEGGGEEGMTLFDMMIDMHGNSKGWQGWKMMKVDKDGKVKLEAVSGYILGA